MLTPFMRIAQHKQRSRHRHLGVGVGVGTDLGVGVGVGTGIDMCVGVGIGIDMGVGVSLGWGSDDVTVGDGVTAGDGIVFICWVPVANTRWKLVITNVSASINRSTINVTFFITSLFTVPPTARTTKSALFAKLWRPVLMSLKRPVLIATPVAVTMPSDVSTSVMP